jgi:hypothetical protein
MKRDVLVILSNRWNRNQTPRFLEIQCDEEGTVLKEKRLRSKPGRAKYDEVWENDEGKDDFGSCHKFSRKYGHPLQKKKA